MRTHILKLVLAGLCLVLFPAVALADIVMIGPCATVIITGSTGGSLGSGECPLAGGGTGLHGGEVILSENLFVNHHSPVLVTGGTGQTNVLIMTITSNPIFTAGGPVLTRLSLNATITILEPGASVDVHFMGLLGGPPLVIEQHFAETGNFGIEVFGTQIRNNLATSSLSVTINGAATFFAAGPNNQFEAAAVPEPASLLLLGSGLTAVAMKLRQRRKSKAG